jgi:hypothetical protein
MSALGEFLKKQPKYIPQNAIAIITAYPHLDTSDSEDDLAGGVITNDVLKFLIEDPEHHFSVDPHLGVAEFTYSERAERQISKFLRYWSMFNDKVKVGVMFIEPAACGLRVADAWHMEDLSPASKSFRNNLPVTSKQYESPGDYTIGITYSTSEIKIGTETRKQAQVLLDEYNAAHTPASLDAAGLNWDPKPTEEDRVATIERHAHTASIPAIPITPMTAEETRTLMEGTEIDMERDLKLADLEVAVQSVIRQASDLGLVLTIWQKPSEPLAMGNYDTVYDLRGKRNS